MDSFNSEFVETGCQVEYYGLTRRLIPPPISTSATLTFLATVSFEQSPTETALRLTLPQHLSPSQTPTPTKSQWTGEWQRLIGLQDASLLYGCFDGSWEGPFNVCLTFPLKGYETRPRCLVHRL